MDLDYLTRLTLSLYKLTEGLEDELLRLKLRRLGTEVLRDFARFRALNPEAEHEEGLFSSISDLKRALKWARRNRELKRKEFVGLRQEYEEVESLVRAGCSEQKRGTVRAEKKKNPAQKKKKREKEEKGRAEKKKKEALKGLKKRQKKVLEILEREKRAQVSELKRFFPDISKRTLRRDIDGLLSRDLIVRKGKWNDVYYVLAGG